MNNPNAIGIYGKIPAHGDFIERNLPTQFVAQWDEWLQRCIVDSRESLQQNWLDIYLTSPVWRFATSTGVIDTSVWAGIVVPSVDSVGRYFPLTIALKLPATINPFGMQTKAAKWYEELTDTAIDTLQNSLNADQLVERLSQLTPMYATEASELNTRCEKKYLLATNTDADLNDIHSTALHFLTLKNYLSYSCWWCHGSNLMKPTLLIQKHLPSSEQYRTLLTGEVS